MFVATVVVSAVLALVLLMSAVMWATRPPKVQETIVRLQLPERLVPLLVTAKTLGAAGVLVGLWVEWLGVAAAAALVAYFLLALGSHLRVGDRAGAAQPVVPLLLTVAVLVLRIASA